MELSLLLLEALDEWGMSPLLVLAIAGLGLVVELVEMFI